MSAQTVDEINILQAALVAMSQAVTALDCGADYVIVDGNRLPPVRCPVCICWHIQAVLRGKPCPAAAGSQAHRCRQPRSQIDGIISRSSHASGQALVGGAAEAIVKGDAKCTAIAAASIIAKVTRPVLRSNITHQFRPGFGCRCSLFAP